MRDTEWDNDDTDNEYRGGGGGDDGGGNFSFPRTPLINYQEIQEFMQTEFNAGRQQCLRNRECSGIASATADLLASPIGDENMPRPLPRSAIQHPLPRSGNYRTQGRLVSKYSTVLRTAIGTDDFFE